MTLHRLLLSLCLTLGMTAEAAKNPSGGLRPVQANDLLLTKRKPRWYNEVWSWQFLFDNGMQASLNFSYARLWFKDPVCGADLTLAGFKGRNFTVGREYPEDRFSQAANPLRVQLNENIWFQGMPPASHHVRFAVNKNEGYFLDLEFSQMLPGVAWGDGTFQMGDGQLTTALAIPTSRVKGRIAVGADTLDVQGWATLEHIRQTTMFSDMALQNFRYFQPGDSPIYLNAIQEKNGSWTGYGLHWKGGQPKLLAGGTWKVNGGTGGQPPSRVEWSDGSGTVIAADRRTILQSNSILDGMEGVTRWAIKQFAGNVRFYRGRAGTGYYQFIQVTP